MSYFRCSPRANVSDAGWELSLFKSPSRDVASSAFAWAKCLGDTKPVGHACLAQRAVGKELTAAIHPPELLVHLPVGPALHAVVLDLNRLVFVDSDEHGTRVNVLLPPRQSDSGDAP